MNWRQNFAVMFLLLTLISCEQEKKENALIRNDFWPNQKGMGVVVDGPASINGQLGVIRIKPDDAKECPSNECAYGAIVAMSENIKKGDHVEYNGVQYYNNVLASYIIGRVAKKVKAKGCYVEEGYYFTGKTWYEVTDMHQDRTGKIIKVQGVLWGSEAEGLNGVDPYLVLLDSKMPNGNSELVWAWMPPDNNDCDFHDDNLATQKNLKLYLIFYEDGTNFLQWAVKR